MKTDGNEPRIVLFGATGYTGRMTAAALVARGERPLLVGRREDSLHALAVELGGLDWSVADAENSSALAGLLSESSVLISLVGPFAQHGAAAAEAAIAAGCRYLDGTGEPDFIRSIFEDYGPRAAAAGGAMITACGYDFVLGNLAGALAVERAPQASQAAVGYFHTGGMRAFSSGTYAALVDAILRPHYSWREGGIVTERGGARVRRFEADGKERAALSIGGSEHFALPRRYPELTTVDVYLGWFGPMTRPMHISGPLLGLPGASTALGAVARRVVRGSRGGPTPERRAAVRSIAIGLAMDDDGETLAEARLEGVNGYDFTAGLLAWAAARSASGGLSGSGALGPIEAFGLDAIRDGCEQAGVTEVTL